MDAINRGVIDRSYTRASGNKALRDNIRDALRRYWLLHDIPPEAPVSVAPAGP